MSGNNRTKPTKPELIIAWLKGRAQPYARLMRLDKPVGIYLLLWPTLWALWIASQGRPDPLVLFVFVTGVVLMRSAGCVINDFADRDFDPRVSRTRNRPIPAGTVTSKEALALFTVLALMAFLLVMLMNTLTVVLSFVGILLAASYPFSKRFTYLPQVHLGLAFGWAIPMAFAAQTGTVPKIAWLLLTANVLWSVAYDTMYAMVDREEDLRIGVKSTALLFADADRPIIGFIQGLLLIALVLVGREAQLGWFYYLGLAVATGFGVYHQVLIKDREPSLCFKAFLNNVWLGGAVFAGIAGHYLFGV
jgi:4-hydroxybenzoate polyprenyltransferase